MSINVSNLEQVIIEKMSSASTEQELLEYSKILEKLKTGTVEVVATFNDLPDNTKHVGELYYVSDEKTVYWYNEKFGYISFAEIPKTMLYVSGFNIDGNLGVGNTIMYSSPVIEMTCSSWSYVRSNIAVTSGIKSDGTLWSMGENVSLGGAMIGDGTTINRSSPTQEITSSNNWLKVGHRHNNLHTNAIKSDGTYWSWGRNACGLLGDGTEICRSSPVQEVTSSTNWCDVSSGRSFSLGIKSDGTLWGWGANTNNEIGAGISTSRSSPSREILNATNWCQVSAGYQHTLALKTNGTLWGAGRNLSGSLGNNIDNGSCYSSFIQEITNGTSWCLVDGDRYSSRAIKTDGTLWGWGSNFYGRYATGDTICHSSPVQEITSSTNWKSSSGASNNSFALKNDGTLWAWGINTCGFMGENTIVGSAYSSPIQESTSATNWVDAHVSSSAVALKLEEF